MNRTAANRLWLAGMPAYNLHFAERGVSSVPLGSVETARRIVQDVTDETSFGDRFAAEYLAVLDALLEGGMPFRILNLHKAETSLAVQLRERGYPAFRLDQENHGSTHLYPRDLLVFSPNHQLALVNPAYDGSVWPARAGVDCWPTDWCEGGRVLWSGDTFIVFRHPEKPGAPDQATLTRLRERGIQVVEIPAGIFAAMDQDGHVSELFYDHHIDRAAGLVADRDGALHLLLGPGYRTGPLQDPLNAQASIDMAQRICDNAGVSVRPLPDTAIPYASSLVQSREGVVLVSGGSDHVADVLGSIVGPENVVPTATPLTHFPVFASAGVHCLITESPEFLLA